MHPRFAYAPIFPKFCRAREDDPPQSVQWEFSNIEVAPAICGRDGWPSTGRGVEQEFESQERRELRERATDGRIVDEEFGPLANHFGR